jgi:uncharacterized Ntn-hydrolase superfamily protein
MTYSLAGRCPDSGQIGFAVTTSSVCVGARVGAVTENCVVFSQARTDPRLHAVGLSTWAETTDAEVTLAAMKSAAHAVHWRQLGVFPMVGVGLHHTGTSCLDNCGGLAGPDCLALGNFLGTADVLPAMVLSFKTAKGPLAERLMAAMIAGEAAGSERDPLQSATIVVLGTDGLKDVDLRIDASVDPLADLKSLLSDWTPKSAAYRLRAIDPDSAPSSSDVEHS